jgi:hypothetical protein
VSLRRLNIRWPPADQNRQAGSVESRGAEQVRTSRLRVVCIVLWLAVVGLPAVAQTAAPASKQLAPGFTHLRADDKLLLMPIDVELFSLSAGGVQEPRADWTAKAHANLMQAIQQHKQAARVRVVELTPLQADDFAEQAGLHAAVAQAIALHQFGDPMWALPTKAGRLDWNFADAMQPLREASGAGYALFVWVRDSYASPERVAMTIALGALTGIVLSGGVQVGYASLIDLRSGQVVWFNRLARAHGDLREPQPARESVEALLEGFPGVQ